MTRVNSVSTLASLAKLILNIRLKENNSSAILMILFQLRFDYFAIVIAVISILPRYPFLRSPSATVSSAPGLTSDHPL